MSIQRLDVKGYRSLKDISWTPGDLNIVIGPNGSGKSNLMRLLELISISAKGNLNQHVKTEGGMKSISWDGRQAGIQVKLTTLDYTAFPISNKSKKKISSSMEYSLELDTFVTGDCFIGEEQLVISRNTKNSQSQFFLLLKRSLDERSQIYDDNEEKILELDESVTNETLLSAVKGPLSHNRRARIFREIISDWQFYHYLRTDLDAPIRKPSFTKYDPWILPDGSNLVSVLHTLYSENIEFKNNIDLAMRSAFSNEYVELNFGPAADNQIQFRIRWKSLDKPVSSFNLSDGTLRFLFLITLLANPKPPSLIAIDEPETGLHPSMMSIIAEYAVAASKRTQVIITTHSADFLDAFHDVTPTVTVTECVDGETQLRIPQEDKLKSWLEDYSLGETFRMRQLEDM